MGDLRSAVSAGSETRAEQEWEARAEQEWETCAGQEWEVCAGQEWETRAEQGQPALRRWRRPYQAIQPVRSSQGVDDESAQQLRKEVGAFGRHTLAMFADLANVVERGGHDQGGERERVSVGVTRL